MKTLTQNQISAACDALRDFIPEVLDRLDIEYVEYPNRYSFPCPVHGGDNPEGCSLFLDGDDVVGNWKCWTAGCDDEYARNIFGFIRGALTAKKGTEATLAETYKFCESIAKAEHVEEKDLNPVKEVKLLDVFLKHSVVNTPTLSRQEVRSKIEIPCKYYIDRGYTPEVLDLFDVGTCLDKNRPMYNRAVVPIYDVNDCFVGCVGRSIYDNMQPKWLHSKGFKKEHLYGLNIAKDHIIRNRTVFLLEGQGDVWRMHEAGYSNSVSIFGASLTDEQLILLEEIGVMNVIILTDYDDAGNKAAQQIIKKCGRRFNYLRPTLDAKDVGDLSIEQLQEQLKAIL
jgi:5S rRNA maturation endonuclease (ribonuclease M5)